MEFDSVGDVVDFRGDEQNGRMSSARTGMKL